MAKKHYNNSKTTKKYTNNKDLKDLKFTKDDYTDEELAEILPFLGVDQTDDDIKRFLPPEGFSIEDVPGDGNCFYHAVAGQVNKLRGTNMDAADIRAAAIDEMTSNLDTYAPFLLSDNGELMNVDDYIDEHSDDKTYTDNPMIQATANALGINIDIYKNTGLSNAVTTDIDTDDNINLFYTGNHYSQLINNNIALHNPEHNLRPSAHISQLSENINSNTNIIKNHHDVVGSLPKDLPSKTPPPVPPRPSDELVQAMKRKRGMLAQETLEKSSKVGQLKKFFEQEALKNNVSSSKQLKKTSGRRHS